MSKLINVKIQMSCLTKTMLVLFMILFGISDAYAQNEPEKVRQVKLGKDGSGEQMTSKIITVLTYDNGDTWVDGAISNDTSKRQKPKGTPKYTQKYLFFNSAWYPTKKDSEVLYDTILLNFNRLVIDKEQTFSNKREGKYTDHKPLDASIHVNRVLYKYDSTKYPVFRDSVYRVVDETYLVVQNDLLDKELEFQIVIKDTVLVEDKGGRFHPGKWFLNDFLGSLGIPERVVDTAFINDTVIDISRIQIISSNHAPAFIKQIQLHKAEERVDSNATPDTQFYETHEKSIVERIKVFLETVRGRTMIVVLVVLVVVLIAIGVNFYFKTNKKELKKEFIFDLSRFDRASDLITNLGTLARAAETEVVAENNILKFEINRKNLKYFFGEDNNQLDGFYQTLRSFIQNPPTPDGDTAKENLKEPIKNAQKELVKLEKFVKKQGKMTLKNDEQNHNSTKRDNERERTNDACELTEMQKKLREVESAFDELKNALKVKNGDQPKTVIDEVKILALNWKQLTQRLTDVNTPSDVVNKIKKLEDESGRYKGENERMNSSVANLEEVIKSWKKQTGYDSPDKAYNGIKKLNEQNEKLLQEKNSLAEIVKRIEDEPESFQSDNKFKKLAKLIKEVQDNRDIRKNLNNNPNELDPNSNSGQLIRKGRVLEKCIDKPEEIFNSEYRNGKLSEQVEKGIFLDKAKDNVRAIREEEGKKVLGDCQLRTFVEYVVNPEDITQSEGWEKSGLYKLVTDVEMMANKASNGEPLDFENGFMYKWLRNKLFVTDNKSGVAGGYNQYILMKDLAAKLGTDEYDTRQLHSEVKEIFDDADRYLKFGDYRNYWKNIIGPLYSTLDNLQNHNEDDGEYNMRALLFYVSQFFSIASIMNEIYGDKSYTTKRPKINVALFNGKDAPSLSQLGFPILDDNTLQNCKFEFKGGQNEDKKVDYLKQFKPLPFLLIYSYFNDNLLS